MKQLTYKDFELAFGEKLNNYIKSIIKKLTPHLQYLELTQSEKEEVILLHPQQKVKNGSYIC